MAVRAWAHARTFWSTLPTEDGWALIEVTLISILLWETFFLLLSISRKVTNSQDSGRHLILWNEWLCKRKPSCISKSRAEAWKNEDEMESHQGLQAELLRNSWDASRTQLSRCHAISFQDQLTLSWQLVSLHRFFLGKKKKDGYGSLRTLLHKDRD